MKLLGASVYARYRELSGETNQFPEDGYHGTYITEVAQRIKEELDQVAADLTPDALEARCRALAYQELIGRIRDDLTVFGIEIQSWFSETSLLQSKAVERALDELKARDLLV